MGGMSLDWAQELTRVVWDVSLVDLSSKLTDARPNGGFATVEDSE
jgi:hypothetical protein